MGISCSMWSFHRTIREGKMDLFGFIQSCADLGIKELELLDVFMQCDPNTIDRAKKAITEAGSKTVCVTLHPRLLVDDEHQRQAQINYVKCWLDVAHSLGAGVVRVNLGGTKDEEVAILRSIEALKPITAYAADLGIKIVLENHGGPTRTADHILRIIKEVGADNLGSLPDFGNFPAEVRYQYLEKIAGVAYYCHAKTMTFDGQGENLEWDMHRCMRIMKDAGYKGSWGIEFEGKLDENTPTEREGIRKSAELIAKYM